MAADQTPDVPGPVLNLLAAISETLEVPSPALDRDAEVAYRLLVEDRIRVVQATIRDVLAGNAKLGIAWEANYLRKRAAERPPTYRTSAQALDELREGRP
ncbi:hypothetical protein [Streptomyces formicae]|uniref:Uncharacterized protein n=1 Tax=Streptomyces formicae TaxID=1616117 RepID=A0ABY3WQQ3_9ACTN|nr:hypothetical protein [Streptomyces formicae]UNM13794.1 hypothetical protein J4032_22115 [Streptomyces formicae]